MQIKGHIIQARREFVDANFGADAWAKVLAALPESDRALIGDLVLAAKWYPFEVGERLDRAIVDVCGKGDARVFENMGGRSAQRSLVKVHRSLLTPGNPQAFLEKAGIIYKLFYNTGRREYTPTGPNSGVLATYDAETYSAPDCLTVVGWYKEALAMCGARNVEVVEEECRAKGGSCCRYRVKWSM